MRFADSRGRTVTLLYRRRSAAERAAERVTAAGGWPTVYAVALDRSAWRVLT